jgi:SSU ribosomal protein S20P
MIKKAEQALENGVVDQAALRMAFSTLDKAAVKGIIHKNNAARRKSRLAQKAKRVALAAQAAQSGSAA